MTLLTVLLGISNGWKTVIMIVLMILVFWLFLIRPQNQQAKKEAEYRNSLKKGDQVMTAGGIHVTVVNVNGPVATVEMAQGVQTKVQTTTLQPIPEHKRK